MRSILVSLNPTGDHEFLKDALRELVGAGRFRVRVAAVPERLPMYSYILDRERHERISQLLHENAATDVKSFLGELKEAGLEATSHVLSGRFPEALCELAAHCDAELVVKQPIEDQHGLSKGDLRLIAHSPLPTLVCRHRIQSHHPVLVGLAVNPYDSAQNEYCARLLKSAYRLAKHLEVDLEVVHVWSLLAEGPLKNRMEEDEFQGMMEESAKLHQETLAQVVEKLDQRSGPKMTTHVLHGDHLECLRAQMKTTDPSVTVLGSVGRSGLAQYVLGSTAETLIKNEQRCFLVIRPDSGTL